MLTRRCACGCMKVSGLVYRAPDFPCHLCGRGVQGSHVMDKLVIKSYSICIDSMSDVKVEATQKYEATITCGKCGTVLKICEKKGKCFLFFQTHDQKVTRRNSFNTMQDKFANNFLKKYIVTKKVENEPVFTNDDEFPEVPDNYQSDMNLLEDNDDDFNLMFSNDQEPFVGSFIAHFMTPETLQPVDI